MAAGALSQKPTADSLATAVFVARQPIFDAGLQVYAHELLFRSCLHGPAMVEDESRATASVIANGLSLVRDQLERRPAFINFAEQLLLDGAPLALHPGSCVIEILETTRPSPKLLKALQDYKTLGYTLALDDYVGQPELQPFLELSDIIKIEVLGRPLAETIKLSQKLRTPGRKLLAEKVEDRKTFDLCVSLGFDYFQGYYFCKPMIEEGVTLKANALASLRVLRELSKDDYNVNEVAKTISHDSRLSYRLLKHLNTPHYSFRGKVRSLAQAVTLMGAKPLKQWLMLVMLADMGEGGPHDELVFYSVLRATFLERLAIANPLPQYSPETLSLVGLFSNLDALLHQPMHVVLEHLPFDATVAAALLGEQNSVRKYLDLSIMLETAQWDAADVLLNEFHLERQQVAILHTHAAAWAFMMLDAADDAQMDVLQAG